MPSDKTPAQLARLQVQHEESLPAFDLLRIAAFCFQARNNCPLVIAETDAQLDKSIGAGHVCDREYSSDPDVNLVQYVQ